MAVLLRDDGGQTVVCATCKAVVALASDLVKISSEKMKD